eukprot:13407102-Alexandrium_andersonii.AAC.1
MSLSNFPESRFLVAMPMNAHECVLMYVLTELNCKSHATSCALSLLPSLFLLASWDGEEVPAVPKLCRAGLTLEDLAGEEM